MLKKFLSILVCVSIVFGMATSTLAGVKNDPSEEQKAMDLIEKTNDKINEKIAKAQTEAGKLFEEYLADVEGLNKEKGRVDGANANSQYSLYSNQPTEIDKDAFEAIVLTIEEKLFNTIFSEVDNSDNQLHVIQDEINQIKLLLGSTKSTNTELASGNDPNAQLHWEYEELTNKYLKKLDRIITNVFNQTKKMSEQTIKKVEKYNVYAVCDWVKVQFGHKYVDIDPIRVVGG
jgi:hypothetical protein